jgi:hypothetical protein
MVGTLQTQSDMAKRGGRGVKKKTEHRTRKDGKQGSNSSEAAEKPDRTVEGSKPKTDEQERQKRT